MTGREEENAALSTLCARIRAALADDDNGWMPIETAPKDGTEMLLSDGGCIAVGKWLRQIEIERVFVRRAKDGDVYKDVEADRGYFDCELCPTHWQPLPPLPKEQK